VSSIHLRKPAPCFETSSADSQRYADETAMSDIQGYITTESARMSEWQLLFYFSSSSSESAAAVAACTVFILTSPPLLFIGYAVICVTTLTEYPSHWNAY
jgi:hypothetical protein